tara:strand:+ start:90 stop:323 length:234 start_codon:yes stop_codon:yes gene_type:complete
MFQKNARCVSKMITKDMIIGECIATYPETAEYLMNLGFHCIGCFAAHIETLEQGLKVHGKSDKEIDKIIEELNKIAK